MTEQKPIRIDLFSDLDNTLIYSHRSAPAGANIPVEMLNGREQSYMTRRTYTFLRNAPGVRLIPVTTRTAEQFRRITPFFGEIACPYALVCNGGELLIAGETDPVWLNETRARFARELAALRAAAAVLEALTPAVHFPSGLMLYAAAENPETLARRLRAEVDDGLLKVLWDRRKVYCYPAAMNKGTAAERFRARYPTALIVTAGDSEFDIPLLEFGEIAITGRGLAARLRGGNRIIAADGEILSDEICAFLEQRLL